ncbi:peptide ABC transporter substrate-binding protein [Cerasicoccus fimbriatus]|uniref:peptide ABC transporter substrate-binding protein n=1 Tax=Cerasicoccus fimbriatus TaxID=3014554 RepID=UPI0022B58FB4|nr:peptide ABC transporter substrate-binding protein [Cerasicoccus sp. TK19100]
MPKCLPVIAIILALFCSGCGQRETPVEQANREQILLRANGTEPSALDPHLVTGVTEHNILVALLEGLVRPDPKTLKPLPGVAERWDISDDGRVYTFHLRDDAKWSNDDPVTAADFAFAYERILSPRLAAEYASLLYPMVNAEAFNTGKLTDFSQVGVKAIDERTLEITLNEATPYFLSLLTHYTWFPVHPPTILAHGAIDQRESRWTRPGNFVGNGPFTLEEWRVHDRIETKKNPLYWGRDDILLNGVHFLPFSNLNAEERAFRSEQIHISYAIPTHKIPPYQAAEDDALRISPYLGTYYYGFNTEKAPLDDARVRRALSLAIDREGITENITKAGQIPASHFTPPDTAGYTAEATMSLDLQANIAEAQRLLAEAGYPNGEGLRELELLYNTSESHKAIAEAIQYFWQTHLGVRVKLINQDWKVYLINRREGNFDIVRAGWIGDYNDPSTFLDLMSSWSGTNSSRWKNDDYDALIRQAAKASNPEERLALFQQAEAILMAEMPVAPIYFYVSAYLVNPAVQGWYPNILDQHPFQGIYLDPDAE